MIKANKNIELDDSAPDRVNAFSDGVFAIIMTIMILELKKPESATFDALFQLWPTWLSYAVSYIFIAVVWVNHHYLLKQVSHASLRLMWTNFAHLFSVSLIPFLTEWIAATKLQSVPVAMYAFVFLLVNITYLALVWETFSRRGGRNGNDPRVRLLHVRSFITLSLFAAAMGVAFLQPFIGFAMICCCLVLYLRPEIRGVKM